MKVLSQKFPRSEVFTTAVLQNLGLISLYYKAFFFISSAFKKYSQYEQTKFLSMVSYVLECHH